MSDVPGFTKHRDRYRAHVTLERGDAVDVSGEATDRGIPVGEVLRDRVKKRRHGKRAAVTTDRHTSETERSRGGK